MHHTMVERGHIFSPAILSLFLFVFLSLPEQSVSNVMITRPGSSDSDCAQKCKEEAEIDCRYYKFHRVKLSCFLSAKIDTSLSHMKKIEKPPQSSAPGTKPASSWISQLQSRVLLLEKKDSEVKALKREIADLRSELAGLKNSRALTHHLIRVNKEQQDSNMEAINEKADVLKSEAKRMEDAIMTLGELQRSFGKKITAVNEDRKSTGLSMAMLGQSNKDMKSSIKELSALSSEVQASISDIRKEMTNLEVRFAGLSTDVMEKAASIESMIGPEVKDLKATQTNLAEALSLITKKIMRLTPRIPELQRLVATNDGMVSAIAKKLKNSNKDTQLLKGRVDFAENQLRSFLDPASKLSRDRRLLLTHLREEVQGLRSAQKRLQSDVLMEISDRTRLYKELSQIKLSKKMFVSDVNNLREQFKKMDKDMRNIILNGPQGDLISKILHRQVEVLKKMKFLQDQQTNMRTDMGKFSQEIRKYASASLDQTENFKDRWNRSKKLNKLNAKVENLTRKLDDVSMTEKKLSNIGNLQRHLTESLYRVNMTQMEMEDAIRRYNLGLYHAPQTGPYRRRWQRRQDRLELNRLRGQTDALKDLIHQSVEKQSLTPADRRRLNNLIQKHRDKLAENAFNQNQNELSREIEANLAEDVLNQNQKELSREMNSKDMAQNAELQDHLRSLHNVLSSLANEEVKE